MRNILVDSHNHTRNRERKEKERMEQKVTVRSFINITPEAGFKVIEISLRLNCIRYFFLNGSKEFFFVKSSYVTKFIHSTLKHLKKFESQFESKFKVEMLALDTLPLEFTSTFRQRRSPPNFG